MIHSAERKPKDGEPSHEHLHTHVVLPGTTPSIAERHPVYNNAAKGHDRLLREDIPPGGFLRKNWISVSASSGDGYAENRSRR